METFIDTLSQKEKKVLNFFLENPTTETHPRALSKEIKISHTWINKSIEKLKKAGLITIKKDNEVNIKANRDSRFFKILKRSSNLIKLEESGIITYLDEKFNHPETIILFGSFAKGEDIENSDIDIAVFSKKTSENLNLSHYEQILKRKISIQIIRGKLDKDFKVSLDNGIVLEGYYENSEGIHQ
jgi:predicted nucleotidyltransferase